MRRPSVSVRRARLGVELERVQARADLRRGAQRPRLEQRPLHAQVLDDAPRSGSPVSAAEKCSASRASGRLAASHTNHLRVGRSVRLDRGPGARVREDALRAARQRGDAQVRLAVHGGSRRRGLRRSRPPAGEPGSAPTSAARQAPTMPPPTMTRSKSWRRETMINPRQRGVRAGELRDASRGPDAQPRERALGGRQRVEGEQRHRAQQAQRAEGRGEQAHEPSVKATMRRWSWSRHAE